MPEGDSLVRLADRLRPDVVGAQLVSTQFRVPQLATADLTGAYFTAMTPRAKYLLMHLALPQQSQHRQVVLLSHLGVDGAWDLMSRSPASAAIDAVEGRGTLAKWRRPGHTARVVLEASTFQLVGFSLSMFELLTKEGVDRRLSFLGPDVLDPSWDEELLKEAVRRLSSSPDRPVGVALLDQRLVSGIGNIYRCETLLLAGIDPHTPIQQVPDLPGLVLLARDLMRTNTTGSGPRITTRVAPDPSVPYAVRVLAGDAPAPRRHRTPPLWVYGRERAGCLRCGGPVRREKFGEVDEHPTAPSPERELWWCPHCQR